jgi:type VI protein secretion system component VasF
VTEHRHRQQLPRWGVFVIVIVFLTLFFLGLAMSDTLGIVLGLLLSFGFLSLAGHWWGYDSTDGRNWR